VCNIEFTCGKPDISGGDEDLSCLRKKEADTKTLDTKIFLPEKVDLHMLKVEKEEEIMTMAESIIQMMADRDSMESGFIVEASEPSACSPAVEEPEYKPLNTQFSPLFLVRKLLDIFTSEVDDPVLTCMALKHYMYIKDKVPVPKYGKGMETGADVSNTIDPKVFVNHDRFMCRVSTVLLQALESMTMDVNVLSDIADTCIHCGIHEHKALKVLARLGGSSYLHNNKQSAHDKYVVDSATKSLRSIVQRMEGLPRPSDVMRTIGGIIEQDTPVDIQRFEKTKKRVHIDRTVYLGGCTIKDIIDAVWLYIHSDDIKVCAIEDIPIDRLVSSLESRLISELLDSTGWCSTGFFVRIANCFSGLVDLGMRLDFFSQVRTYVVLEIQRRVRDEDMDMLEEITEESFRSPVLHAFVRKNIYAIEEAVKAEFTDDMNADTFNEYFSKAVHEILAV
jgi:hypothetical protein